METIEMIKNKFVDLSSIDNELYNMCVNYIKERLSSLPNNEIYFDQDVSPIRIRFYDYREFTYALVNRVYLIDEDIYVDTEYIDGYELTGVDTIYLYKIAREIFNILID